MNAEAQKNLPDKGSLVRDTKTDQIGVLMDVLGSRAWLRKLGGGREWETDVANVEAAQLSDQLAERLREERRRYPRCP